MADDIQILVRFITKLPAELRVPQTEVAVPVSIKRYGLSQIINHLLALDPPRPFDFLVAEELLRKSLQQHLLDHGISTEAVLEVEYLPAVVPPEAQHAIPHDDWVSAVAACSPSQAASGSYDGSVRLWDDKAQCVGSFTAHAGGVTCMAAVAGGGDAGPLLVTGGRDYELHLWRLSPASASGSGRNGASSANEAGSLVAVYRGHEGEVACVAASPSGAMCCSGGWDGQLLLWRAGEEVLQAAAAAAAKAPPASAKKRKVADSGAAALAGAAQEEPAARLEGHSQCVASVAWGDASSVVSGGWDHSVRRWDAASGINTDTYNGSKAIMAVAAAPNCGGRLVAFGGSETAVRLWDTRAALASGEGLGVRGFGGHAGWVAALAWSPASSHHFASASHDGALKLWDTRAAVALATLSGHADKVLALAWWGPDRLLSGGADCKLRMYAPGAGGIVDAE